MGVVRAFEKRDVGAVAELHRRVFDTGPRGSAALDAAYRRYFGEVLAPSDERIRSLVYETDDGRIAGFLGVVTRPMAFGERKLVAAVSSQFVVAPEHRSRLVGVELLRAYLAGPQDLSMADEATSPARTLWESLGGRTALLYSLCWTRPLRPSSLALSLLGRRRRLAPFARMASPLARAMDGLAARLPDSHLRQAEPRAKGEAVSPDALAAHLSALVAEHRLRPQYEARSLAWAMRRAAACEPGAPLRAMLVRDASGRPAGAYVYRPRRGGSAEVVHLAAPARAAADVLEHLFWDAWREGAVAVEGRAQPRLLQALSDRYALLHRRGSWVLVHASRPEVLSAFDRGEAFLSRLEGEMCLRFHPAA